MNAWRVVKVGGSLFDYEELPTAFRRWLALQPPLPTLLLAGGGELVDAIRRADVRFNLSEETAHWLAIKAMSITARLLAALLPEAELKRAGFGSLLGHAGRLSPNAEFNLWILDPEEFLRHEEPFHANPLPHAWSVTSDSIAARLAELLKAHELVLLKSALARAGQTDYVDAHFAAVSLRLPQIRCVNLRSASFEEAGYRANTG